MEYMISLRPGEAYPNLPPEPSNSVQKNDKHGKNTSTVTEKRNRGTQSDVRFPTADLRMRSRLSAKIALFILDCRNFTPSRVGCASLWVTGAIIIRLGVDGRHEATRLSWLCNGGTESRRSRPTAYVSGMAACWSTACARQIKSTGGRTDGRTR